MSLKPQGLEPIPQATSRLAHKSSPKGTAIMRLRDALGPIYQDEAFTELFPRRGRPAQAPWRLALVTVFQAMENLSDRQAAQMVAMRMDWKYALSLEPEDEGFDYSVLSRGLGARAVASRVSGTRLAQGRWQTAHRLDACAGRRALAQ